MTDGLGLLPDLELWLWRSSCQGRSYDTSETPKPGGKLGALIAFLDQQIEGSRRIADHSSTYLSLPWDTSLIQSAVFCPWEAFPPPNSCLFLNTAFDFRQYKDCFSQSQIIVVAHCLCPGVLSQKSIWFSTSACVKYIMFSIPNPEADSAAGIF